MIPTTFATLPEELQIKIWKHALPEPRIMRIKTQLKIDENGVERLILTTPEKPTALLRACKLSRQVTLETLNVCIAAKGSNCKIRLDGKEDVVCFWGKYTHGGYPFIFQTVPFLRESSEDLLTGRAFGLPCLEEGALLGITTLAMRGHSWIGMLPQVRETLAACTSLKTLILLINPTSCFDPILESDKPMHLKEIDEHLSRRDAIYASIEAKREVLSATLERNKDLFPEGWTMPEISLQAVVDENGVPYNRAMW